MKARRHHRRARRLAREVGRTVGAGPVRTWVMGLLLARLPRAVLRQAWRVWRDPIRRVGVSPRDEAFKAIHVSA